MSRVEREEAAPVLHHNTGLAGHESRAEFEVQTLDQRHQIAVFVRGSNKHRFARERLCSFSARRVAVDLRPKTVGVLTREQLRQRDIDEVRIAEITITVAEGETSSFDQVV